MENICDSIDFALQGGIWSMLSEALSAKIGSALIVEQRGGDLVILEALNVKVDGLVIKGVGDQLLSMFPAVPIMHKGMLHSARVRTIQKLSDWPYAMCLRGTGWTIFVLMKEEPSLELMEKVMPFLKVIPHWHLIRNTSQIEQYLSRLSYMILATKSTLGAAFEPMGLEPFTSLLYDVLRESFFPDKMAIYSSNGVRLQLMAGEDIGATECRGLFDVRLTTCVPLKCKQEDISVMGLNTESLKDLNVIILPMGEKHEDRLFCVCGWKDRLTEGMLNFLELLGNVLSKAFVMRELQNESLKRDDLLSSCSYAIAALHNALEKLTSKSTRIDALAYMLGMFSEFSQASMVKLVVYDNVVCRYELVGEVFGGIAAQCFEHMSGEIARIKGNGSRNMTSAEVVEMGFSEFADIANLSVYPFWVENELEGFVVLKDVRPDAELMDYPVVFQAFALIAGRELKYRLTR